MNTLSRNALCSVAATAAVVLVTAVVAVPISLAATQADKTAEVSSVQVRIGDLDAHTAGGAQHIYFRLQRAAEQVCGDDHGARTQLELVDHIHTCEQQAIEPAVDGIHAAPLTAIYARHFPERSGTVAFEQDARG
jgi:UrcA family protein